MSGAYSTRCVVGLGVAAFVAGCATTKTAAPTPQPILRPPPTAHSSEPPAGWQDELTNASAALASHRFDDARAALNRAERAAHGDEAVLGQAAYLAATLDVYQGAIDSAVTRLSARLPWARSHPELPAEFWLHNQLTWLRWAQGDRAGALAEADAQVATATSQLDTAHAAELELHALWDRAYLLRELAVRQPPIVPVATQPNAEAARALFDGKAEALGPNDGIAVLDAFFATLDADGPRALAAASKVDWTTDSDMQDLYILAGAFDAGGDRDTASKIRQRIITSSNVYLLLPVYQKLASDDEQARHQP